ncbi:hypothetical protein KXD97_23815 [Mycobacterium sp. SMC-8]|uniref:hypothetical protein n=1 Tax=Mycobacterium sp. SMC-8 TaxID=2857060 RepID=UPI0021B3BC73|nr:hypothetical protein [Mycobacterium sp. SMC-8]UXA15648.1 hypothetical protein KXD97_23815 [Mycobacterium sp. SMC-8]
MAGVEVVLSNDILDRIGEIVPPAPTSAPSTGRSYRRHDVETNTDRPRRVSAPSGVSTADTETMFTAFWVIAAVIAVGAVAGGLVRMRAWLQKPVPPEVIEAARRDDDENAD